MPQVTVQYAFPAPALFDHVAVYIELGVVGGPAADLLPPDMASLRFGLSGIWAHGEDQDSLAPGSEAAELFGTTSQAQWVSGQDGAGFCIGLHPLAWSTILNRTADRFVNRAVPLGEIWPEKSKTLHAGLVQSGDFAGRVAYANDFLLGLVQDAKRSGLAHEIMAIRQALADPLCADVASMAKRVGISQVRLGRLTKAHFGFSPKLLIRRERFRRMLHRIDAHSYANWPDFLDPQYVDQSHMIRDFHDFLGLSPGQYMALERPFVAAAFATFRAMMGVPPADGS